jgi:hypothetical protein
MEITLNKPTKYPWINRGKPVSGCFTPVFCIFLTGETSEIAANTEASVITQ